MTGKVRHGKLIMRAIHAWALEHGNAFDVRDLVKAFPTETGRSLGNSCRWLQLGGLLEQVDAIKAGSHGATVYRFRAVEGSVYVARKPVEKRRLIDPERAWAQLMNGRRFEDVEDVRPAVGPRPSRPPTLNPTAYT